MELVKDVKKAEEKSLNESRTRTTSGGMELAADSSGGVIDNESDGKEVTCLGMLETITTIVDCAEENRQLLDALEQILVPLALHIFQQLELPGMLWAYSSGIHHSEFFLIFVHGVNSRAGGGTAFKFAVDKAYSSTRTRMEYVDQSYMYCTL